MHLNGSCNRGDDSIFEDDKLFQLCDVFREYEENLNE